MTNYSKCCCCSIKVSTITVAILEFIGILITLVFMAMIYKNGGSGGVSKTESSFFGYQDPTHVEKSSFKIEADKRIPLAGNMGSLIGTLIGFLVGTASIIALLIGVVKERPKFVFIHLMVQGLAILGLLIGIIYFGLVASDHMPLTDQDVKPDHFVAYHNKQEVQGATPDPDFLAEFADQVKETRQGNAIGFCILFGLGIGVQMIFAYVVFKCFRYLSNKA